MNESFVSGKIKQQRQQNDEQMDTQLLRLVRVSPYYLRSSLRAR